MIDHSVNASVPVLRRIADLPGPRPWPLVGNLLQMRAAQVHQYMERWSGQYGPVYKVRVPGVTFVVLADHELIGQALRERPGIFRRPRITAEIAQELGGLPGVFEAEGAEWRNQRKMVMQAFAPHAIKAWFPSLVTVVGRLQRRWERLAREGHALDLGAELRLYTVDVIAGLAFGTEVNTIETGDNAIQRHLDLILPGVARRALTPFPYWRYVKLAQDRRLERAFSAVVDAAADLVARGRERLLADPSRARRPANMLEAMLVAADEEGSGVSERDVAGNVITMLLAGEDTTSNALAWLIWLLDRNPDALSKAREEVLRLAPDPAALTIEQIDGLDYLEACVQEAMRLKPPAPYIPLEALQDTVIGDLEVPKATIVWCVLRHQSVDNAFFPDAARFAPERWLEENVNKKVGMPFGSGPRTCPGRYLALLEIKLAMAMLLARFTIQSVTTHSSKEPEELMGFVMAPERLEMRLAPLT